MCPCVPCVSCGCPVCVSRDHGSLLSLTLKGCIFSVHFFSTFYFILYSDNTKIQRVKKILEGEMQLLSFPPSCLFYLLLFLSTRALLPCPWGLRGQISKTSQPGVARSAHLQVLEERTGASGPERRPPGPRLGPHPWQGGRWRGVGGEETNRIPDLRVSLQRGLRWSRSRAVLGGWAPGAGAPHLSLGGPGPARPRQVGEWGGQRPRPCGTSVNADFKPAVESSLWRIRGGSQGNAPGTGFSVWREALR